MTFIGKSKYKENCHKCSVCQQIFKKQSSLNAHLLQKHDIKTRHICDICQFKSANLSGLKSHYRKHVNDQLLQCLKCRKKFSNRGLYDAHSCQIAKKQCNYCSKWFGDTARLNVHLRTHTENGPLNAIFVRKLYAKTNVIRA